MPATDLPRPWASVPRQFRERGLRWTPQRRAVVDVLAGTDGHVTGAELVDRCRARDPSTIPSTVYRTLDVLEELGLVRHGHGADGREEYHVGPGSEHGHMHCSACGASREIPARAAERIAGVLAEAAGFEVDVSHVTVVGRCRRCRRSASA
ncbi:MAG TPA: Fur family transcriptional regulator [Candidatus Limnocylindria bacterium]|nr:Fur family transcriptional regulator [Candidatus Limnocylindria bacterium]